MFTRSLYQPRSSNKSGKFEHVPPAGIQRFDGQLYREWHYEIGRRKVGMTIKRVHYSVAISRPEGGSATYLSEFSDLKTAHLAARRWIDATILKEEAFRQRRWESPTKRAS